MTLFLDSSNPAEIRELFSWGCLSGVTTNPLIIVKEAGNVDLKERILQVLEASTGPVSVELTTENYDAMLDESEEYLKWNHRIVIKVPFSETGMKVLNALAKEGVKTNVTCLMAFNQAYLAALAGATYVSIFSGRVQDMGYDVRAVISATRKVIDQEGLPTKIIVGSIRHITDVNEALEAGAHVPTIPPSILRKMVWNPRTESTIEEFNTAWRRRGAKP